jgi:general secretion pathway protein K
MNACRRNRSSMLGSRRAQGGIALILVLWIVTLLTVIAGSFSFSMRTEALAARNQVSLAQARTLADGAVYRAIYEASRPPQASYANTPGGGRRWRIDRGAYKQTWQSADAVLSVSLTDESGKIDLNVAADALLKNYFKVVGGIDEQHAQQLLEEILDWRDADDLRRPNGAEEADYRAAGRSYKPTNAPFDTVGDLQRVLDMTPALYEKLAPFLTVYSRASGINAAAADRPVLLSLPGATPEAVDAYLAQRREAIDQNLPLPQFAPAAAYGAVATGAMRIRAQARLADGTRYVRDAVYRPGGNPTRATFLLWEEGAYEVAPVDEKPNGTDAGS